MVASARPPLLRRRLQPEQAARAEVEQDVRRQRTAFVGQARIEPARRIRAQPGDDRIGARRAAVVARRAHGQQRQGALLQQGLAERALDLAAGGAREHAGTDEGQRMQRRAGARRHGCADAARQRIDVAAARQRAAGLDHHRQALAGLDVERKGGAAVRRQLGAGAFGQRFHILGVDLAPVDHDDVLAAPGNIDLAVAHETEVAAAQPARAGHVVRGGRDAQAEQLGAVLAARVVAARDARPGDPEFAHLVLAQRQAARRIDHRHLDAGRRRAAADQLAAARLARQGFAHLAAFERGAVDRQDARRAPARPARHQQRGLGHAVAGEQRLAPQPAARRRPRRIVRSVAARTGSAPL